MQIGDRSKLFNAEDAVSDVVGTVLILAITVAAFSALSFTVMNEVSTDDRAPRIVLEIQTKDGTFLVQHQGGESLPARYFEVFVYGDVGETQTFAGSCFRGSNEPWSIGQSLYVSSVLKDAGSPAECQWPNAVNNIEVRYNGPGPSTIMASSATGDPHIPASS